MLKLLRNLLGYIDKFEDTQSKNDIDLLNINRDIAKVKEDQLNALSIDRQNQVNKTQQLLGFFGAVSAIIFSQDISLVPGWILGIILTLIIIFIVICIKNLLGQSITSMINVNYISDPKGTEKYYLMQKINEIEKCLKNLRSLIIQRNNLNNTASGIFGLLIIIYAFIFLIYIPMTNIKIQQPVQKNDVQYVSSEPISASPNPQNQEESGASNTSTMVETQQVIKTENK